MLNLPLSSSPNRGLKARNVRARAKGPAEHKAERSDALGIAAKKFSRPEGAREFRIVIWIIAQRCQQPPALAERLPEFDRSGNVGEGERRGFHQVG
jgi:hypothetical protein